MISRIFKSEVARHGAVVFGGVVLASVFNYLYFMLIARRGGVETYGVVTGLTSAMYVLLTPGSIGQLIAARLAADLEARHDNGALRTLAERMTFWTTLIATIVVGVGLLNRNAIEAFFNLTDAIPVVVATVSLGLYAIVAVQRGVLQGAHRFNEYSASSSIDAVVKVLVGVPLVVVLGATGGLLGVAAGVILVLVYNLVVIRIQFGSPRSPIALDRNLILRVVSQVGLGQLTFTVLAFFDVPLIKHAFDGHSAGLYAAAALVGRALIAATSFIPTLVMPKVSARLSEARSPLPLLTAALCISSVMVATIAFGAFVVPRFVITLFSGAAFSEAAPLVFPYTIASGALALANVVAAYKMGLHRYDFVLPCLLVAGIEIGVLSYWHPSLQAVVGVLIVGHIALLAVTLHRVWVPNEAQPGTRQIPGLEGG